MCGFTAPDICQHALPQFAGRQASSGSGGTNRRERPSVILRLPLLARSAESRWIADVPTVRRHELAAALLDSALAGQDRSAPESQRGSC